jgi:hypothetical protein
MEELEQAFEKISAEFFGNTVEISLLLDVDPLDFKNSLWQILKFMLENIDKDLTDVTIINFINDLDIPFKLKMFHCIKITGLIHMICLLKIMGYDD